MVKKKHYGQWLCLPRSMIMLMLQENVKKDAVNRKDGNGKDIFFSPTATMADKIGHLH